MRQHPYNKYNCVNFSVLRIGRVCVLAQCVLRLKMFAFETKLTANMLTSFNWIKCQTFFSLFLMSSNDTVPLTFIRCAIKREKTQTCIQQTNLIDSYIKCQIQSNMAPKPKSKLNYFALKLSVTRQTHNSMRRIKLSCLYFVRMCIYVVSNSTNFVHACTKRKQHCNSNYSDSDGSFDCLFDVDVYV